MREPGSPAQPPDSCGVTGSRRRRARRGSPGRTRDRRDLRRQGVVGVPPLAGRVLLVEPPAGGLRGCGGIGEVEHEPAQLAAPVERGVSPAATRPDGPMHAVTLAGRERERAERTRRERLASRRTCAAPSHGSDDTVSSKPCTFGGQRSRLTSRTPSATCTLGVRAPGSAAHCSTEPRTGRIGDVEDRVPSPSAGMADVAGHRRGAAPASRRRGRRGPSARRAGSRVRSRSRITRPRAAAAPAPTAATKSAGRSASPSTMHLAAAQRPCELLAARAPADGERDPVGGRLRGRRRRPSRRRRDRARSR